MKSPHTRLRRERALEFIRPRLLKVTRNASLREGAALAAGFLVMLVTAWLIWAALAEAALAVAHAG